MAPTLQIRLLGELSLRDGTDELPPLESARAVSLLAYLLLNRAAPQSRQRVAFLLWPDSTEPQALTNLRHLLHTLRRALPDVDRFLEVTQRTLGWRPDAPCWLDVAAFEDALDRSALEEAVELYRGDLLEGFDDEWLRAERARLQRRYLAALEGLAPLLEARGDHAEAILSAERLLRLDPLQEEAYRLLMRMHAARGDRARALRVFHVCAAVLEHELGVEPSAPTREAHEALLQATPEPPAAGGSPLVGRSAERERSAAVWRASAAGRAQLLLVTGEAGVGKTRLVEELRSWCARAGAVTAEARSYAAEGALAYGPVVAWLRTGAFAAAIERLDGGRDELARLLPELGDPPATPQPASEHERRVRLFDTVARVLLSPRPLLLVADDLQWWDPDSLQLLHYLLRVEPEARLLVAATARAEDVAANPALADLVASLRAAGRCAEIALERLTRRETALLAERLAGDDLQEPDQEALYGETEGNPLFVVEAVRAGWARPAAGERWPTPRVQTVIESRLAQLTEPARQVVGVAATIGREFTTDVLAAATGADEETLVPALDELWRRRVIQERGADGYDFTHDKIREVALTALSPAVRRSHHRHIAGALQRLHGGDAAAGQLAAHLEAAGAVDAAVTWYLAAADAAQRLDANADAVHLLGRAIELSRTLPPTPERRSRELALLTALPAPLGAAEGYGSARLQEAQRQALELTAALGIEPAPPLLRSLAVASLSRGEFDDAERFGRRLRAHGERDPDGVLLVESDYVLGIAAFWRAEFEAARGHFEAAVERYRPELRTTHVARFTLDPQVVCLSRLANTWWFLGRPDEALRARDAALALAREVANPASRGTALVFAALLAVDMHEPEQVRGYSAALAEQLPHQMRANQAAGDALRGFVDVLDGDAAAGIARMQQVLDGVHAGDHAPGLGAAVARLLLEACVIAGDASAGLAAANRLLTMGGGARVWEPEARRARTELSEQERSRNARS